RIAVNPELAHETGDHPKEGNVLEVAGPNEVVKTVCAVWREGAGDFNREVSLRRLKLHFEGFRRLLREFGGVGEVRGADRLFLILLLFLGRNGDNAQRHAKQAGKQCCFHAGRKIADAGRLSRAEFRFSQSVLDRLKMSSRIVANDVAAEVTRRKCFSL